MRIVAKLKPNVALPFVSESSKELKPLFLEGYDKCGGYFKLISSCGSDGRAGTDVPMVGTNPIYG